MTARERLLAALLKEAVKIIHCHLRNLEKDWLNRARAALSQSGCREAK